MGERRLLAVREVFFFLCGLFWGWTWCFFCADLGRKARGRHRRGVCTAQNVEKRRDTTRAANAVRLRSQREVKAAFAQIGDLLEDRGTKFDAHVHMIERRLSLATGWRWSSICGPFSASSKSGGQPMSDTAAIIARGNLSHPTRWTAYSPCPVLGWASF